MQEFGNLQSLFIKNGVKVSQSDEVLFLRAAEDSIIVDRIFCNRE